MKVTTFDVKKKREVVVGDYDSFTNTLTLKKKAEHFMRKYNGWGMQKDIFERAMERKCTVLIQVGKKTYKSDMHDWNFMGTIANEGHGIQIFLNKSYMELL